MDTKEPFVETFEVLTGTGFTHTKVGNWIHILKISTGEGSWHWLGKEVDKKEDSK